MKKLANILALLFAVVMIATGCKKLPEFTDGSSSGNVTPTTGGTLYYRLNGEPEIGADFISISAKFDSQHDITDMILQVCEDITMSYEVISNTIDINGSELSGNVSGLQPSTHYYWCILYTELGLKYTTDPVEFTTAESGENGTGTYDDPYNVGSSTLQFDQIVNYGSPEDVLSIMISTNYTGDVLSTSWTVLDLDQWPSGTDWTFVRSSADLTQFIGQNVVIAFKYTSTDGFAPTWEIKNVVVSGN